MITSGPRNITAVGGNLLTYYCDGRTPFSPDLPPINTPTAALDEASKKRGFIYSAEFFDESFYDFGIYKIGPSQNYNEHVDGAVDLAQDWIFLVNYQEIATSGYDWFVGGCHDRLAPGDDVLWAFTPRQDDDYTTVHGTPFLKLSPAAVTVKKGKKFKVTVIDGKSGTKIQGASVSGVTTDLQGTATLSFSKAGFYQFKATKIGTVRSNLISVTVTN